MSKSKLCYDRRSVCQSVLESSPHLGPKIIFLLVSVADLLTWGAPSDGRAGLSFTIADGLARAVILGSESRGTHSHILLSQIRDSPRLEGQIPSHRVAQLYSQAIGSLFVASYNSQGYGGGIWTSLYAGKPKTQSQCHSCFMAGGLPPISSS
jgi:hypothetical protein